MKKKYILSILIITLFMLTGCTENVKIVQSETKKITYEDYNNGLISMKIPTGWKVEVAPVDYIHYSFKLYNPSNKNIMLLFGLKQEGFLKTEKARKTYAKEVESLAREENILFFDTNAFVHGLGADGCHFTKENHAAFADGLFAFLNEHI